MKKDIYDEEQKRGNNSGVNGVVAASVCAFLLTITIGGVILFSIGAKNKASLGNEVSNEVAQVNEIKKTQNPLFEKIDESGTSMVDDEDEDSKSAAARVPGATKIDKELDSAKTQSDAVTSEAGTDNDLAQQGSEDETSGDNTDKENAALTGDPNEENAGTPDSGTEGDDSVNEENGDGNTSSGETYISGANWEYSITPANSEYVSLAFAGDILFDPGYAIMNKIRQNGGGIDGVIGGSLLSYMRGADIMVVNNEFPYSYGGSPTEGKTFTFRAEPSSAGLLNQMGVDVATLANNHAYDYGETALLDTLSAIDSVNVARIGAGANLEEASHPVYYTADNGLKIAIIAATEIERLDNPDTKGATDTSPGVFRCLDITKLVSRIKEAKSTGAYVIVCIHWGTENKEEIDWWQQKQAPEIVDAGADLIVGAHPHILQKIGYVNGVPVVYSLGNFLFNSKELETGLLRVNVYKDGQTKLQFIPALQSGCTVSEATGDRKASILNHMRQMSAGITIDDEGYVQ